jgi:hypothetical protein
MGEKKGSQSKTEHQKPDSLEQVRRIDHRITISSKLKKHPLVHCKRQRDNEGIAKLKRK